MPSEFSDIRAAATDGRAHNHFFRHEELKRLHAALSENASEIQDSMVRGGGYRNAEAKAEFWLAMRCLRGVFSNLEPKKSIQSEYAISYLKDAPEARQPIGVIVVKPPKQPFFYSLISALAPAIAEGNCVVVQVQGTLLESSRLVLALVEQALDDDTFCIARSQLGDETLRCRNISVVQEDEGRPRVVGIVERDANIQEAAKVLVHARFVVNGKSQYAPDIILVNEWVKDEFCKAILEHSALRFAEEGNADLGQKSSQPLWFKNLLKDGNATMLSSDSRYTIIDVKSRNSGLMKQRSEVPILAIHSATSMDDAINLANSFGRLGASYVFAAPSTARYISQFLNTQMTFVDHIPINLLHGPLMPANAVFRPQSVCPYDPSYFTLPSPQYIHDVTKDLLIAETVPGTSLWRLEKLGKESVKALAQLKRPSKMVRHGYFEQGIITGLVLVLGGAVVVSSALGYRYFHWVSS